MEAIGRLFVVIIAFTLTGLSDASSRKACDIICGGGGGSRDSPILYPNGPNHWTPHAPGIFLYSGSNGGGGGSGGDLSGRVGETVGLANGFESVVGKVEGVWDTKLGLDSELEGHIDGHREHEQLINLAGGGYIKDKDGINWGLKGTLKPTFGTQITIKGELGYGGRRRRRRDVENSVLNTNFYL